MQSVLTEPKRIRKFQHFNIIKHLDYNNPESVKEELENDFNNQSINTSYIKINPGADYSTKSYEIKAMIIPNANYTLIKDHLIQSYKILKCASNFKTLTRVFLISYSHGSLDDKYFISYYHYYETFLNKSYEIDSKVYEQLMENPKIKHLFVKFDKLIYFNTILYEESGTIKELEEEISEVLEDAEFCFDIHLLILSMILKERKILIVPLWINHSNLENMSFVIDALSSYYKQPENIFIFSTNVTYFGRLYNFFGNAKYKSKSFLRDKNNEREVIEYLQNTDEAGIKLIMEGDLTKLSQYPNFIYSRNVYMFAVTLFKKLGKGNFDLEEILYSNIKQESPDESEYELYLVSFLSTIFYSKC